MNTYLSSADLKDKAKGTLRGHYGMLIGSSLVISMITFVVTLLFTSMIPTYTVSGVMFFESITFLISVFTGVFNVGLVLIYLKFACGNQASLSDIFYGYSHHINTALGLSLINAALSLLVEIPSVLPSYLYRFTGDSSKMILVFPLMAVALVIYVPLSLGLSQCWYLMLDFPDKTTGELISLSFRIMKGHKARLFYISISFIPLMLLGFVSIIGLFWVIPYLNMTTAHFYLDIMKPEQN